MAAEEKLSEESSTDEIHAGQLTVGKSTRKRRIITLFGMSFFCVALLTLLGSQLLVPAQNQSNTTSSPLLGHRARDFTLAALSARPAPAIHLASFKGKPVMLNFWASWCDPCKHEASLLEATWQHVRGQGVVFIGIDFEDRQSDGLSFLQTYGITYPNAIDASGSVAINYGVTGVPETVFIDRRGVIVGKVIGELTEQTLESNLQLFAR